MNIWFGRRLRILAWHAFRAISRSHQQQERERIAQQKQPRVQVQAPRASGAQHTRATAPQHISRKEQHEQEKQLKHFSAAQHAESRRYLLPGEEYKTDAPRVVEPTSRVAMFTQVPQVIKMPQQPQAPAQDWSSHELRMRAGIYTAPEPARKRSRQFKKVGGAWVPIE